MPVVYLLHFDQPISERHTCQHYLGWTTDLHARLAKHAAGSRRAARLTQVAKKRGIGWRLVRLWEGGRPLERRLKARKESPKFCPLCNPKAHLWAAVDTKEISLDELNIYVRRRPDVLGGRV